MSPAFLRRVRLALGLSQSALAEFARPAFRFFSQPDVSDFERGAPGRAGWRGLPNAPAYRAGLLAALAARRAGLLVVPEPGRTPAGRRLPVRVASHARAVRSAPRPVSVARVSVNSFALRRAVVPCVMRVSGGADPAGVPEFPPVFNPFAVRDPFSLIVSRVLVLQNVRFVPDSDSTPFCDELRSAAEAGWAGVPVPPIDPESECSDPPVLAAAAADAYSLGVSLRALLDPLPAPVLA